MSGFGELPNPLRLIGFNKVLLSCDKVILLVIFVAKRKLILGISTTAGVFVLIFGAKISTVKERSLDGLSSQITTLDPFCDQD